MHAGCNGVAGLVAVVEYLVILSLFFYYTEIEQGIIVMALFFADHADIVMVDLGRLQMFG